MIIEHIPSLGWQLIARFRLFPQEPEAGGRHAVEDGEADPAGG